VDLATLSSIIAVVFYFAATFAITSRLFHHQGPQPKVVFSLGCLAVLAHSVSLANLIFTKGSVNFSLVNVISLVALNISLGMTVTALRNKTNLILPMVYSFSGLLLLALWFIPDLNMIAIDPSKLLLVSHITLALLSYCILVIATLYAIQVEYINYKLKTKNLMAVNHLPPLMKVESQLFTIMAAGTSILAGSQLLGFAFIDGFYSKERAHETVLSVIALGFYCTILWAHYKQGWRGHKILILTFIATAILTLSYFGSRFIKEFILS
jgi:ABC-type uncharacterized transport system permease subunit